MKQIKARMAKSNMNTHLISFKLFSSTVTISSLSSSTDSLPVVDSSSFPSMFTTVKTSTSNMAKQQFVALITSINGIPSLPALAPTLVDSKA
ncbi:hypothetical protein QOT17_024958 [Balamuthia mandrillaris]